jgi:glycosyltransferase involved in cell wall biosynthesis
MKIGLYGGLANNLYIIARALAKHEMDICFIRDRGDHYPFSQPVWQDVPCALDYDNLNEATTWTWERWKMWELQLGWKAPNWLVDPLNEAGDLKISLKSVTGIVEKALCQLLLKRLPYWSGILRLMAECDILLVNGIEGPILALMSGKPFMICPYGGDIRTAAGFHAPRSYNPFTWLKYWIRLRLLRSAYKKSLWIMAGSPTFGSNHFIGDPLSRLKLSSKVRDIFMPCLSKPRLSKKERINLLTETVARLGIPMPRTEWIGFVPSRVDFFWKGQDRLLRAFSQILAKEKIHVIVSGWGQDYHRAKTMVSPQNVTFLPYAVSKPILYDFYQGVDFVVDQFCLGYHGTSTLEAMSCGTPVLMWINEGLYRKRELPPPPVLNAKNEEDILGILTGIISGEIDLEEHGCTAQNWVQRVHSEEIVIPGLIKQFTAALSKISCYYKEG